MPLKSISELVKCVQCLHSIRFESERQEGGENIGANILSAVYSARPVAESVRNGTDSLAHHQRQQQLHKQFCTEPGIIERPFKLPLPVWRSISTDDAESKERRSKIRLQRSALTLFTEF